MSITQIGRKLAPRWGDRGSDDSGRKQRARTSDPWSWTEGAGIAVLLGCATLLFTWDLTRSGFANSYYAAAAQAGSESWKAFLFGSLDAQNAITVDKPPMALWPMALSVRAFGLSSLSILLPQVLEGVVTVAVLYTTVRRTTGSGRAALVAGAVFALTPVTVLMFRYNNPDALLTLLLVCAAATALRSLEGVRATAWMAVTGTLVGAAFLDKLGQAFLVVPALSLAHLLYAESPLRHRIHNLVAAGVAAVVTGGSWIAAVSIWPSTSRPWIGGTSNNSAWQLAVGYNGIGRLTGNESSSVGLSSGWHTTNFNRMFGADVGAEIMWLVPAALLLATGALWSARSRSIGRSARAALVMWLTWFGVTMLVYCVMGGIFHSYYTVTVAPAIAALVAIGGRTLWLNRDYVWVSRLMGWASVATTIVAGTLVLAQPGKLLWLVPVVGLLGAVAPCLFVLHRLTPRLASCVILVALVAALAAPTAYSVATTRVAHAGSSPRAGPVADVRNGRVTTDIITMIQRDASRYSWPAAVVGARGASAYELATGQPVLAIGGYKGTDPYPTLAQFQSLVATGQIHYVLDGQTIEFTGPIAQWVRAHFTQMSAGGVTYYDVSGGTQ